MKCQFHFHTHTHTQTTRRDSYTSFYWRFFSHRTSPLENFVTLTVAENRIPARTHVGKDHKRRRTSRIIRQKDHHKRIKKKKFDEAEIYKNKRDIYKTIIEKAFRVNPAVIYVGYDGVVLS